MDNEHAAATPPPEEAATPPAAPAGEPAATSPAADTEFDLDIRIIWMGPNGPVEFGLFPAEMIAVGLYHAGQRIAVGTDRCYTEAEWGCVGDPTSATCFCRDESTAACDTRPPAGCVMDTQI